MTTAQKHRSIINYLHTVEKANIEEIYDKVPFSYFSNAYKHMSILLSGMVRAGKIERVKPGVFRLKQATETTDPNQLDLFNQ